MGEHTGVILGSVIALMVGYGGILAATTQFKPTDPDRSDGNSFLNDYYARVTDPKKVQSAWNDQLDKDFKRNLEQLQGVDEAEYKEFWRRYTSVAVDRVEHVGGSEEYKAQLTYTFRKGGRKSAPEQTFFTLRCPGWTAFTIFGCDSANLRIHDTHTG